MGNLAHWIRELITGLDGLAGGSSLFLVACFDSSLLSLPEVNDLLLIYFATRFEDYAYFGAVMMVLGSATGCTGLYWLARWRGYGVLKRRYPEGRLERVFRIFERYGALAVFAPALLPPPMPFKIFIVSSGLFGLSYRRFLLAVLLGRGIRYFGEAFLAVRFGEQALSYLRENSTRAVVLVVSLVVVSLLLLWLSRYRGRGARELSAK